MGTSKRRPLSAETKAKIGAANRGKRRMVEQRAAMSVAHSKSLTRPETMEKHRSARRAWWENLTPEKRAALLEARSVGQKARWARLTKEERSGLTAKNRELAVRAYVDKLSKMTKWELDAHMAPARRGASEHHISDSHRGILSRVHKGKTLSDETRRKISKAKTGRGLSAVQIAGQKRGWAQLGVEGRKERSRIGVSALKRQWDSLSADQRLARTKPGRVAASMANPSSIERTVAVLLDSLGLRYLQQYPLGRFVVDFLLPDKMLVIECDGSYWHNLPGRPERDAARDVWLRSCGYEVLRLPEQAIRSGEVANVLREVAG